MTKYKRYTIAKCARTKAIRLCARCFCCFGVCVMLCMRKSFVVFCCEQWQTRDNILIITACRTSISIGTLLGAGLRSVHQNIIQFVSRFIWIIISKLLKKLSIKYRNSWVFIRISKQFPNKQIIVYYYLIAINKYLNLVGIFNFLIFVRITLSVQYNAELMLLLVGILG